MCVRAVGGSQLASSVVDYVIVLAYPQGAGMAYKVRGTTNRRLLGPKVADPLDTQLP